MFQKNIHKVKFYPSADDFTQALLEMLVTNIMSVIIIIIANIIIIIIMTTITMMMTMMKTTKLMMMMMNMITLTMTKVTGVGSSRCAPFLPFTKQIAYFSNTKYLPIVNTFNGYLLNSRYVPCAVKQAFSSRGTRTTSSFSSSSLSYSSSS